MRSSGGRRGLAAPALTAALLSAVVLSACGEDGASDVERAQAQVDLKKKAVQEAESAAAAAQRAFCGASGDYIAALDRYGDVLHATAPTVGDVVDAGADLEAPRDDAVDSAEAAVEAQQQLAQARQELAEAKDALAAVKAGSTPPAGGESPAPSPEPLVPAATVNRVKEAEADLESARGGITDETPLAQAAQQFNAAAVALEMSWLALFGDAGCLTDEQQQQASSTVRAYTTTLQQSLATAGYYDGEVDGVYGPATVDAVGALQKAHGLPVTGTVDSATAAALQADVLAEGGAEAQQAVASTAALQQTLALAGFWDGPVDGNWTPALTDALKELQTALDVEPTGTVDAATVAAFHEAIAQLAEPAPSATPSPTSSPSASPSPEDTPSAPAPTDTPTG